MVDDNEMRRLEESAGLRLTSTEKEELREEIERVLLRFHSLEKLDTEGPVPCPRAAQPGETCRDDTVSPSLSQKEALLRAPEACEGYFVVPPLREHAAGQNW